MFIFAHNINKSVEFLPTILSILGSIIVGISKAGVKGIGVFFVILLAYSYEPKTSTGILLPLLIVGDLFAIIYYKKNIVWKYIFQLIPWMAIGVLFATLTGDIIDEVAFKKLMSKPFKKGETFFIPSVLNFVNIKGQGEIIAVTT